MVTLKHSKTLRYPRNRHGFCRRSAGIFIAFLLSLVLNSKVVSAWKKGIWNLKFEANHSESYETASFYVITFSFYYQRATPVIKVYESWNVFLFSMWLTRSRPRFKIAYHKKNVRRFPWAAMDSAPSRDLISAIVRDNTSLPSSDRATCVIQNIIFSKGLKTKLRWSRYRTWMTCYLSLPLSFHEL